jgi:thiamine pyrophosphate-dependent acetolactate synthase large subunit-like protein
LLGELITAAELGLPLLIIVVNNGGMAIEHNRAVVSGYSALGSAPRNPDFVDVARGCGLTAIKAVTLADLEDGLAKGIGHQGPFLIEVITAALVAPTAGG